MIRPHLTYDTVRRLHRAGACPILEVCITYPRLCAEAADDGGVPPSVLRFNEAYRAMAEHWLAWADGPLLAAVSEAFAAAGAGAAYRFDRQVAVCAVRADEDAVEGGILTLRRTVRLYGRRGEIAERFCTSEDVWRWPSLLFAGCERKT